MAAGEVGTQPVREQVPGAGGVWLVQDVQGAKDSVGRAAHQLGIGQSFPTPLVDLLDLQVGDGGQFLSGGDAGSGLSANDLAMSYSKL